MREKQTFTLQTLLAVLVLNGLLLAAVYWFTGEAFQNQWVVILGLGLLITLVLWFIIQFLGNRLLDRVATTMAAPVSPSGREERPLQTPPVSVPAAPKPAEQTVFAEDGALQILAILQRQGRLIDFLQEDLTQYEDAQIGAAVRSIHSGCKQALADHLKLAPIFEEGEGAVVTVQPGFDPHQVRLTGNVVGNPPFKGELRHRGWRVIQFNLPEQVHRPGQDIDKERVVAAAEVEVNA